MARRQRSDKKIFGVVDVGVPAENRVGTPNQVRLAVDLQSVLAPVPRVAGRTVPEIALPDETGLVVVRVLLAGCWCRHVSLRFRDHNYIKKTSCEIEKTAVGFLRTLSSAP